ncbi:MAG: hypothetical protein ACI9WM_001746, partial [Arenicella sp.]
VLVYDILIKKWLESVYSPWYWSNFACFRWE